MNYTAGMIVDVTAQDGVSKFRGTITAADEHHFTVQGHGWTETFTQDTPQRQVEIVSWG